MTKVTVNMTTLKTSRETMYAFQPCATLVCAPPKAWNSRVNPAPRALRGSGSIAHFM